MTDFLIKLRLFLCAYAPLFLISGIRFDSPVLMSICLVLAVLSTGSGYLLVLEAKRISAKRYLLDKVEDAGAEVSGYLASYLLPFVTVAQPTYRDMAGYLTFIVVAAAIYLRSGMLQINPTLYLFGWRVFAVHTTDGLSAYLLVHHEVAVGTEIQAARFKSTLLIEKG